MTPSDFAIARQRSQHLTFFLGDGEYAIAILRVREIIEYSAATRVPGTPEFVHGVINLRGSVVPVIDLARKLGLTPSPITKRTCAVVVETELQQPGEQQVVMALLADSVSQVVDFQPDEIIQPPAFGTNLRVDYLAGLGKLEDRFILMLDIDRVLSAGELMDVSAVHALVREVTRDDADDQVPAGDSDVHAAELTASPESSSEASPASGPEAGPEHAPGSQAAPEPETVHAPAPAGPESGLDPASIPDAGGPAREPWP
jgi:purine-binding chemotaxis protein CheW